MSYSYVGRLKFTYEKVIVFSVGISPVGILQG